MRSRATSGAAGLVLFVVACNGDDSPETIQAADLFQNNCAACHGPDGEGAAAGPPLVDEMYAPEQTSDAEIRQAVEEGVPADNWNFGAMPAIPGLDDEQVAAVVEHVRELQRDAGLID